MMVRTSILFLFPPQLSATPRHSCTPPFLLTGGRSCQNLSCFSATILSVAYSFPGRGTDKKPFPDIRTRCDGGVSWHKASRSRISSQIRSVLFALCRTSIDISPLFGFEEPYAMYPMDFEEFLMANGVQKATLSLLQDCYRTK